MDSIYVLLTDIKAKLETIDDVKTLKIGLETGIGTKDCPFVRIVTSKDENRGFSRVVTLNIVYGFDIKNKDLESMYQKMYELEEKIIDALQGANENTICTFISNTMDEDKLKNLKSSMATFEVEITNDGCS